MTAVDPTTDELQVLARRARREIINAVAIAKGGHLGGPLSAIDILLTLYFRILNIRPGDPSWEDRDRFILSKGHSSIALYAALALRGYFPVEELSTYDAIDSRLQGHPDMTLLPGLDMSTGSLGLGFSAGVGIALGAKLAHKNFSTFVMVGDGECNEGIIWEGAHVAERYALDNLVVIVDANNLQQFGWRGETAKDRLPPYSEGQLLRRWEAFGWHVCEVDGHNFEEITKTLRLAAAVSGSPVAVIAHTIKGKGVSFMQGDFRWHSRVPTAEELDQAMTELGEPLRSAGV
jgi:transketolase